MNSFEVIFLVYILCVGALKLFFYIKCKKVKPPCSKQCSFRFYCEKRNYDLLDYMSDLLEEINRKKQTES